MKSKKRLALIITMAVVAVAVIAAVMTAGTYSWLTFSGTSSSNIIQAGTLDFDYEISEYGEDCECECDECTCQCDDTCYCLKVTNTGNLQMAVAVSVDDATANVCGTSPKSIKLGTDEDTNYYIVDVNGDICFCLSTNTVTVTAYAFRELEDSSYIGTGFNKIVTITEGAEVPT